MIIIDKIKNFLTNPVETSVAYATSAAGIFMTEGQSIIPIISALLIAIGGLYNTISKSKIEARKIELEHELEVLRLKQGVVYDEAK